METSLVSLSLWEKVTSGLNNVIHTAKDTLAHLSHPTSEAADVTFLAHNYPSRTDPEFLRDVLSRPYFSYRAGFEDIYASGYSSDQGWGCMLRSGQTLLAQAFLENTFSRGFLIIKKFYQ